MSNMNFGGDSYKRNFIDGIAQCGCYWTREKPYGDILNQCPIHHQATLASVKEFEIWYKSKGENT